MGYFLWRIAKSYSKGETLTFRAKTLAQRLPGAESVRKGPAGRRESADMAIPPKTAKNPANQLKFLSMSMLRKNTGIFNQGQSCLIKRCASEVERIAGASPARRVRLFTTEHDLNSIAARRGWKLRKMNRWAVMTMNHI